MRFRVLSWNIHKGIGGVDRRYRPERTLEVIRHYRPDLVLMQEVDEGVRRSSFHRQVDVLGDALELRHRSYGPNVRVRRPHRRQVRDQGVSRRLHVPDRPVLEFPRVGQGLSSRWRGTIFSGSRTAVRL